ncbi:hypothetical protein NL676_012559 [Syzygium grande]|nr:hypothetical protein NL676_012559 [Syzygium grande]
MGIQVRVQAIGDPTPSVGNLRLGAEVAGRGSGSRVGAARSGAVRRESPDLVSDRGLGLLGSWFGRQGP